MSIEPRIESRIERFIQNFSAVVLAGGFVDLIEITVPAKCTLTIANFGNYCDTVAAWGTIYWQFMVDDHPLYPYEQIMDQIGFGTGRQDVQAVEIFGGHRLRIRAVNPTMGNVRMGISLAHYLKYQE
jgi:hypothetical protein